MTANTEDALRVPPRRMVSPTPPQLPKALRSKRPLVQPPVVRKRTNVATEIDPALRLASPKLEPRIRPLDLPLLPQPTHSSTRTLQLVETMDSRRRDQDLITREASHAVVEPKVEPVEATPLLPVAIASQLRSE